MDLPGVRRSCCAKRKIVLKLAQCALLWLLLIRVHFPQKFFSCTLREGGARARPWISRQGASFQHAYFSPSLRRAVESVASLIVSCASSQSSMYVWKAFSWMSFTIVRKVGATVWIPGSTKSSGSQYLSKSMFAWAPSSNSPRFYVRMEQHSTKAFQPILV